MTERETINRIIVLDLHCVDNDALICQNYHVCGRFNQSSPPGEIAEYFSTENSVEYRASYNVTPSSHCPVIRLKHDSREMALCHWGLVPSWAKDKKLAPINAKAETVREKPFFRSAFKTRRCIIPINGFYEWQGGKGNKIPFYIHPKSETFFGLAGLWESWETPDEELQSFTIITTEANDFMQPIHQRMPVILDKDDYEAWLSDGEYALLKPSDSDQMQCYPVSTRVNSPGNDGADLIKPHSQG